MKNDLEQRKQKFLMNAKLKYGEKYDYSLINFKDSKTKINIKCKEHDLIFEQTPYLHLSFNGCSKCLFNYKKQTRLKDVKTFINEANLKHNNKYNYSESVYTDSKSNIIIICPIHGKFQQIADYHLQGRGCRQCAETQRSITKLEKNSKVFIEKANKIHNNKFDYSKFEYITANTKTIIICPFHGEFEQKPTHHLKRRMQNLQSRT